jgi:hypothetical protein
MTAMDNVFAALPFRSDASADNVMVILNPAEVFGFSNTKQVRDTRNRVRFKQNQLFWTCNVFLAASPIAQAD